MIATQERCRSPYSSLDTKARQYHSPPELDWNSVIFILARVLLYPFPDSLGLRDERDIMPAALAPSDLKLCAHVHFENLVT